MRRKLMLVLLAGAICLLAVTSVLAQKLEFYNLEEYEQLTGKKMVYQEAPILSTMVAAGELLPVEERLPEEPLVVKPLEEIGQYGGTLRRLNEKGAANYQMNFGYEFLVAFYPDMEGLYPNVLKAWEASEDAKKFTLYLRKGMRWSDGYPFTADDFMFWYKDVALNKELYPSPPSRLMVGGKPGVMRKIDDYTIEVSFDVSFGLFIENFARWRPNPYLPKHYFKQFHPNYTPMDEIEKVMKEEGQGSWVTLFLAKMGDFRDWWGVPERPVIGAWVAQNLPTAPLQVMTRNPYYWKVDTEGNQLPYIDKLTRFYITDSQAMLLKSIAGEVDMQQIAYFGGMENIPIIMENQEKGNYRVVNYGGPPTNYGTVHFNFSHQDPVLKKLFNDKRFRIALSVAINREEINKLVYKGLAVPANPAPGSGPPYYGERISQEYLQYDPKLANQLLDEIGLTERDKEGYRLRPDGKQLRLANSVRILEEDAMLISEEYKKYWKAIGINVINRPQPIEVMGGLQLSGKYDIITSNLALGGRPANPLYRMGIAGLHGSIAPQWSLWVQSKGEQGERPPEEVLRMVKIREEALSEPEEEKRIALTVQIFEILAKNFWVIGGLDKPSRGKLTMFSNRLGNAPRSEELHLNWGEWIYSTPAQYYFKK